MAPRERVCLKSLSLADVGCDDARHARCFRNHAVQKLETPGQWPVEDFIVVGEQHVEEKARQWPLGAQAVDVQPSTETRHGILERQWPAIRQERDHFSVQYQPL